MYQYKDIELVVCDNSSRFLWPVLICCRVHAKSLINL